MAPITSALTRVLVTGFGPFAGVPNNPSWGIASRLPTDIGNNITLFVHPEAVPVAYKPVLSTVPELVSDFQPDISLHIGVAEGRTYFAVEQTSRRGVYSYGRDVNGEVFPNADGEKLWGDQATVLSTDINLHGVVDEWQRRTAGVVWPKAGGTSVASKMASTQVEVKLREDVLKVEAGGLSSFEGDDDDDVRWSDNVGTYLCAFIYYTSMVEMSRETVGHRRDTAFMHVPLLVSEEELQMGVDITVELIQSLVGTWRDQRAAEGVL
ncbi:hypothetical protein GRF29_8g166912 [Pseudopithomyces chartarum]|uniref:Peptidase C15, pyroglutamyl peptidase I-like protein n=1 Tax=Pseudopithomyces chartarum TaxID=1892770 RepID=A0AAN6M710_9PLEO|nr:hypothetical protein GRF29_8g166912 [Pseudopithomyces chartarum]